MDTETPPILSLGPLILIKIQILPLNQG